MGTKRTLGLALAGLVVALGLVLSGPVHAADSVLDQVTVDNTAGGVGLTATKYAPNGVTNLPQATLASCRVRTAEISFVVSGLQTVTTTVGQLAEPGDWLYVNGFDRIKAFKAIRTGATSGQLDCVYSFPN